MLGTIIGDIIGDADTLARMAGGIAEAYYKKIPVPIIRRARKILDNELLTIVDAFTGRYGLNNKKRVQIT